MRGLLAAVAVGLMLSACSMGQGADRARDQSKSTIVVHPEVMRLLEPQSCELRELELRCRP